jgi:hypothetical protein
MTVLHADVAALAARQDKGYTEILAEIRLLTAPQGTPPPTAAAGHGEGSPVQGGGSPADAASTLMANQRGGVGLKFKVCMCEELMYCFCDRYDRITTSSRWGRP